MPTDCDRRYDRCVAGCPPGSGRNSPCVWNCRVQQLLCRIFGGYPAGGGLPYVPPDLPGPGSPQPQPWNPSLSWLDEADHVIDEVMQRMEYIKYIIEHYVPPPTRCPPGTVLTPSGCVPLEQGYVGF
jgi:hypothetical protein